VAFEDELDPDWFYELPFYLTAVVVYGALFTLNPTMRWGARERTPDSLVPIEFVAALPPPPSPNLAPAVGGDGRSVLPPQKGPGHFEPEKIKAGAVDAPPKPLPNPKPAAVKSTREKSGTTLTKPAPKAKAVPKAAVRKAVDAQAVIAASVARRRRADDAKAAKSFADAEAARRAAEAKAEAQVRAEIAREKAAADRAAAAQRAEDARLERARRVEAARVEKERLAAAESARREQVAAARAAKAAKKAELSQQLATMNDPDNALDGGAPPPPSGGKRAGARAGAAAALAAGAGKDAGGAVSDDGGAALAGERKAGAAAALAADTAESADPGDAAGSGGADILDANAKGGGTGPDGSGVSYFLDGPVGNRRVLKRAVPTSPDWVATRGLDLAVIVRFQVLPDGSVKPGAVIQKTSGFPEIDRRALDALRSWRFEAVPARATEVWGRVKFRFTN
jgi:TonB family protein